MSSDPLNLEGAEAVDEGWEEDRLFTPLYHWQLTMVADRKVSPDAVVLWHCLLTFGRKTRRCLAGNALLSKRLGVSERSIRRYLGQLIEAGWVSVRLRATPEGGTVRTCLLRKYPPGHPMADVSPQAPPTGQNASSDRPNGVSRPASSGHRTKGREPEEENHTPIPPQGGGESVDLSVHWKDLPSKQKPAAKPKRPRGKVTYPAHVVALAQRLIATWPHAQENGITFRRSSCPQVCERLSVILADNKATDPDSPEFPALSATLERAVQAERDAHPPGSPRRPYVPALHVYLNPKDERWTAHAERAEGAADASPVVASFQESLRRAEEARRAREAADPTMRFTEERKPLTDAERAKLEAEYRERSARLVQPRGGEPRLIADLGDGTRPPPEPTGASMIDADPGVRPVDPPKQPRGSQRVKRPKRTPAEIEAELAEHKAKRAKEKSGDSDVHGVERLG